MTSAGVEATAELAAPAETGRRHFGRRRKVLTAIVMVALAAVATTVLTDPYGGTKRSNSRADNAARTSLASVTQRNLSAETNVNATLGYAGAPSVAAPTGTSAQALKQAQQAVTAAEAALSADQTQAKDSAASSAQTLAQDEAAVTAAADQLAADQAAQTGDCAKVAKASACTMDKQTVAKDQFALAQARSSLSAAQLQAASSGDQTNAKLAADRQAVASAQTALADAQAAALNPGTAYTAVPAVDQTLTRGQTVYALNGIPVPLWYGTIIPWRAFTLGMTDGPDVGEITANLIASGFGAGLTPTNHFSPATQTAVKRWQASLAAPQTGTVALGDVVVEPGPIIVRSVTAVVGGHIQPGQPILTASSTARQVTIALDAAQQAEVKVGDKVAITLPGGRTTSGVVSSVGRLATAPATGGTATITVVVTPTNPAATGSLDQAPVEVAITTATVDHALVVPVNALLALSTGGYAIETVDAAGIHHLLPVSLGLFDDAQGLVQVTGSGVAAGLRVVVPAT
jgi:multidrug efflux pump subunit AcrA (membrane-fusion protein)